MSTVSSSHQFVNCLYITVLFIDFCCSPMTFLALLFFSPSYPSPSVSFGRSCLSIFSPSYFCSLLQKYKEAFLSEHDFTWIVGCIWWEWRSIHFILVVVEVPLRIYCGLLFHYKQTKDNQQKPRSSVEIGEPEFYSTKQNMKFFILHLIVASSSYLEKDIKCAKWCFSLYMLFQSHEVTGSGTWKQVVLSYLVWIACVGLPVQECIWFLFMFLCFKIL